MEPETNDGQVLRENLFTADLLQLPAPEEGLPGFLPEWFTGSLPALVYPPLRERGIPEGGNVDLQITPYHLYYGALRELAETADAERAETLRRLALEWNPQAALEVCELARAAVERDLESALLHYELAMELDEDLYEAVQDAGMCEYALASVEGEDPEERIGNAEELFRRAIELNPQAGLSWWSLARVLSDRGEGEEAQDVLQQFLDEYPDGDQREMIEQALHQGFEEFAGNEPDLGEGGPPPEDQAAFQQAQQLAFGGEPGQAAEAVSLIEPLAQRYPESGEIWFVLGAAQRRAGDLAEAERCLRRAARLAPNEPFVWWELSRACAEAEQWPAAEDALRKCLEAEPDNAIYLADLAKILVARGDRDSAEEAVQRAQELAPDDPSVQEALAALEGRPG